MIKCIIITGPTGSGKSRLASVIAKKYNGCILNADSQQILKELPILTDQPKEDSVTPMFLYGHKTCLDEYSSFKWCLEVDEVIKKLNSKTPAIIVGGTGFYLNNLLEGHFLKNPKLAEVTEKIFFINFPVLKILINPSKDELKISCKQRIEDMFPGVLDEVNSNPTSPRLEKVIGFSEIKNNIVDVKEKMLIRTLQYIKRQKTWFKKYCANWNNYPSIHDPRVLKDIEEFLKNKKL